MTSGIYTVLNAHQLAEQDGQISVGELGGILDKQTYPIKMHGFLLDLMRKFDLCFAFGDDRRGATWSRSYWTSSSRERRPSSTRQNA